jgi:AcrR family transcriptional regulator
MVQALYDRRVGDEANTAVRLVTAAERLFADGGEEGTSLRAVARAAHANAAAVHYHFGGRDELLRAVLDRHLGPLNTQRLRLLDKASERHGEAVPVDVALDAVVRPDLRLLAKLRGQKAEVARLLGRAHAMPGVAVAGLLDGHFRALAARLVPILRRALPELGEAELVVRLRLVMGTVAAVLAAVPSPDETGPLGTDDVDLQVRRLVAFCAAGMTAPGVADARPRPRPDVTAPEPKLAKGRRRAGGRVKDRGRSGTDGAQV